VVFRGNSLEHGLGELHVAVLEFTVRVAGAGASVGASHKVHRLDLPGRVVNRINEFLQSCALVIGQGTRH